MVLPPFSYADAAISQILGTVHTIAMIGASDRVERPSHEVMTFLQSRGYRVIPVNPKLAGTVVLGEPVKASLDEIGIPVDMIDVFRNSAEAGALVDEAIVRQIPVVWMQLGVEDPAAAARGEAAGVTVVMDRCPKIEILRLGLRPVPGEGARGS